VGGGLLRQESPEIPVGALTAMSPTPPKPCAARPLVLVACRWRASMAGPQSPRLTRPPSRRNGLTQLTT
jgi:hypothetical protein